MLTAFEAGGLASWAPLETIHLHTCYLPSHVPEPGSLFVLLEAASLVRLELLDMNEGGLGGKVVGHGDAIQLQYVWSSQTTIAAFLYTASPNHGTELWNLH